MKLETYLNAMWFCANQSIKLEMLEAIDPCAYAPHAIRHGIRERQRLAFRARILRMFEELEAEVEDERNWANFYMQQAEDTND